MDNAYQITHNWGHPRDPEYHDGLPVSYATYRDGNIYLPFRIVPTKQREDESITWVVEAPATIRKAVGGSGSKCTEICNRVVEYVNTIDVSSDWRMRGASFTEVSLDTSKIPGWWATKVEILKKRHARLLGCLPTIYPAIMLTLGYVIAYLSYSDRISVSHNATIKAMLFTLGCMTLIHLATEIYGNYQISKMVMVIELFRNRALNYKWAAIKIIFRAYGIRYAVTSILAILLFYFAAHYV